MDDVEKDINPSRTATMGVLFRSREYFRVHRDSKGTDTFMIYSTYTLQEGVETQRDTQAIKAEVEILTIL